MICRIAGPGKPPEVAFALAPWNEEHPQRQSIEERIPTDHLARWIDEGIDRLDLEPLRRTYDGRGTRPIRPELLLKVALYEIASGKPSPAEWFRDTRDCDTVKWLGRGIQPSRTTCYDFWNRVTPFFEEWNAEVLHHAVECGMISGARAAQDGTSVAAHASRHRLVNQTTLARRQQELNEAIIADTKSEPVNAPGWMARHPQTRLVQQEHYERAAERMRQLQAENQQRRACKRQKSEKIVVSVSDPEAAYGRDKLNVFRPLYNVQFWRDLDSPFVLSYQVFSQNHDSGTLTPLIERSLQLVGLKLQTLLADSAYASVSELAVCDLHGITMYAPVSANDFSVANQRKPHTNQFTKLSKTSFTWLASENTYACPEGHPLELESKGWVQRHGNQRLQTTTFRCPPEHCRVCPRRAQCTPNPEQGRTVTRLEHEELLEALRDRMASAEAKSLYRLRSQTVELTFADLKEHRSLRRFCSRGLSHAHAQVGAFVLCYNLVALRKLENASDHPAPPTRILQKMRR